MTTIAHRDADALALHLDEARRDYAGLKDRGLSLDLTRGKPSPEQLDLSAELLTLPGGRYTALDGTDCRNYGAPGDGLRELRDIFAPALQVPVDQLLAVGNSSLELMHDCLVHALLGTVPGAEGRWADQRVAFLCPVPGYDRHFALCERLGIDMIPVPMTDGGPDMSVVENLVRSDARIKGIWCVPKYSNPDGTCYSDETVRRLSTMETAAPDFRIFWDNAYAVHHLDGETGVGDILAACAEAGHPDRVFVFGSTSKITFAGAGVAFLGSSPANVAWWRANSTKRTIGPDKLNQLRHALFLKDTDGLRAHMRRHRRILAPKFETVDRVFSEQLGDTGLATWTRPKGGYFVALTVLDGCAREVVRLAAEAGIAVTPAGATHPHGNDPDDRVVRIGPSYPTLEELEQIAYGITVCVRLAGYERLTAQR
ncbi:aminotransferase class I/II-fold pyridoxal phosphate-dependent enzyme [Streptomyces caelestis]|uniref:aminotransferase class I/II-fold pyridoxal phosphate-dependent enzyme n=1 Tax=Streptomyces caelestis TaxID=36816 RepID=UPI00380C291D